MVRSPATLSRQNLKGSESVIGNLTLSLMLGATLPQAMTPRLRYSIPLEKIVSSTTIETVAAADVPPAFVAV
jgi:hypothetical protein